MNLQSLLFLFKANLPVVAIDSPAPEELSTVETILREVAQPLGLPAFIWDLGRGFQRAKIDETLGIETEPTDFRPGTDPVLAMLDYIEQYDDRGLFILLDLHSFLCWNPLLCGERRDLLAITRRIKNLAFTLKQTRKRIILLGQNMKLPEDFTGLIYEINLSLPNAHTISDLIQSYLTDLQQLFQDKNKTLHIELDATGKARLIRAVQGLTEGEIRDALRLAAVQDERTDTTTADLLNDFKIRKLRKYQVEFSAPPDVEVGGLDQVKQWFRERTQLFDDEASQANLQPPKGILLFGIPGTGKSLIAKTIGHLWNVPVLSVDMGSVYSSLVGESESNLSNILQTAEAVAPCVLFIDELEKALAGTGTTSGDSGVGQRLLGKLLTWMAEKTTLVFVIATANFIDGLPPEFSRKGRFDEVFFVDLPQKSERAQILNIHLAKYHTQLSQEDLGAIAHATKDFSGAELAALAQEAAIRAFNQGRAGQITLADLQELAALTIPLAQREQAKIQALRDATKHARLAASPDVEETVSKRSRQEVLL
ncbi:MAG: AAA family ATPase [Actinomycetota bacterium]